MAFLLIFFFSLRSECQMTNDHANMDIYKNFVGHWTGFNEVVQKGAVVRTLLDLVVTEEKNGKLMRLDYTYGKKGEKDFAQSTRYVELRPEKAVMVLRWKGEAKMPFKTDGLEQFAKDGLGKFTAQNELMLSQQKVFDRGTFELQARSFFYKWERSVDGINYTLTSVNLLNRENGATLKTN
jgi:hypothetical protein